MSRKKIAVTIVLLLLCAAATPFAILARIDAVHDSVRDTHAGQKRQVKWLVAPYLQRGFVPRPDYPSDGPVADQFGDRWKLLLMPYEWTPLFFTGSELNSFLADTLVFSPGPITKTALSCPTKTYGSVQGQDLILGDDCGYVYRIDPGGQITARIRLPHDVESPPAVSGDTVIFNGHGGTHVLTGPQLDYVGQLGPTELWAETRPLLIGDATDPIAVLTDERRAQVIAVGVRDNRQRWAVQTRSDCESTPVRFGDAILFGCQEGAVYKIRQHDGAVLHRLETNGQAEGEILTVGDQGYFGTKGDGVRGHLYRLDLRSMRLRWDRPMPSSVETRPVVCGDTMVVAADWHLVGIAMESGKTRWITRLVGRSEADPACIAGQVWQGTRRGVLYRVSPTTGQIAGRFLTGGVIYESHVVTHAGRAWVADMSGHLYGFQLPVTYGPEAPSRQ